MNVVTIEISSKGNHVSLFGLSSSHRTISALKRVGLEGKKDLPIIRNQLVSKLNKVNLYQGKYTTIGPKTEENFNEIIDKAIEFINGHSDFNALFEVGDFKIEISEEG